MSDLFERMAEMTRPEDTPRIVEISVASHNYGYVVTCTLDHSPKPYKAFHVSTEDVCEWIEEEHPEYLEWVTDRPHPATGEHVQEVGQYDAEEYVDEQMTEDEWYQYLKENNLTDLPYVPE